MQLLNIVIGALLGGGFALAGQGIAHRFAGRRERNAELRDTAATYLAQVQNFQSVLRSAYANKSVDSRLNTDRLDVAQVPYKVAETRLRWVMEALNLPTGQIIRINLAWTALAARWPAADESEWEQLNADLAGEGSNLELTIALYLSDQQHPSRRLTRRLEGTRRG